MLASRWSSPSWRQVLHYYVRTMARVRWLSEVSIKVLGASFVLLFVLVLFFFVAHPTLTTTDWDNWELVREEGRKPPPTTSLCVFYDWLLIIKYRFLRYTASRAKFLRFPTRPTFFFVLKKSQSVSPEWCLFLGNSFSVCRSVWPAARHIEWRAHENSSCRRLKLNSRGGSEILFIAVCYDIR